MVAQLSPSVATRVSCDNAPNASDGRDGLAKAAVGGQAPRELVEEAAEQHAVDRTEEQGSVRLVDQHRQATVVGASGRCLLHPQVGGVAVMAVGDQGPRAGQRRR